MAEQPPDSDFADLDPPFGELVSETVPCQRCGEPSQLKSFRLPPKLCDKCRAIGDLSRPPETIPD